MVKAVADVVALAVAEAVSKELSDFQALAGLESQVEAAAETLTEVGSDVRSGAESVAEAGKQVRAGAENLADGISAAVADTLNDFIEQFRILVQTLVALLVLALGGFLTGALIGIRRGEVLGCGVLVGVGLIAALLAASNLGTGYGLVAAVATGVVFPFAGTALAIIAIEAAQRWLALLRSLSASFRNALDRSG